MKKYVNLINREITSSATTAMKWHRAGTDIMVHEPDPIWGHKETRICGAAVKTSQQKTDDENYNHCRSIAEDVENYANGNVYRCPECGETITLPEEVGDKYKCPYCGTVHDVDDLEELSLWDYLEDVYDIQYVIDSDRHTVRSVKLMVACGGPNIYLDTSTRNVELYWWTDRASYPLSLDACDALDSWAQEMFDLG